MKPTDAYARLRACVTDMLLGIRVHKPVPILSIISELSKRIEWNTGLMAAHKVA